MICKYCGSTIKDGDTFCQSCGQKVDLNGSTENSGTQNSTYNNTTDVPVNTSSVLNKPPTKVSFGNQLLRKAAIVGYICCTLTLIINIFASSPVDIVLTIIEFGLVLGYHLGQSKVCAWLFLIFAIASAVIVFFVTHRITGYLVILAGIWAVRALNQIEEEESRYSSKYRNKPVQ